MRALLEHERPLVSFLFELAALSLPDPLLVESVADGGMGSLAIAPADAARRFGAVAAECHFRDSDNVPVLAALFLDEQAAPLEVDVWKVDFSALARWPAGDELTAGSPNQSLEPTAGRRDEQI
jgi:hypothetical protein